MTFWMQSVVSSQAPAVEQTHIFHNHLTVGPFWVRSADEAAEVCRTGRTAMQFQDDWSMKLHNTYPPRNTL